MIIKGNSVSECWLKAMREIENGSGTEISPVILNIKITNDQPDYEQSLRSDLNAQLKKINQPSIETTANTIFPESLSYGILPVFDRFEKIWRHVKHCKKNRHGHYFRRLVSYAEYSGEPVNQLKKIIETYNAGIHRRSALIATVFDPNLDHVPTPQRGFPCLQQVCFVPDAQSQTLTLNAIYAVQYLSDRAYGNYLGLVELGNFMAGELGLKLTEVNCMISVLALGNITKSQAKFFTDKYDLNA